MTLNLLQLLPAVEGRHEAVKDVAWLDALGGEEGVVVVKGFDFFFGTYVSLFSVMKENGGGC